MAHTLWQGMPDSRIGLQQRRCAWREGQRTDAALRIGRQRPRHGLRENASRHAEVQSQPLLLQRSAGSRRRERAPLGIIVEGAYLVRRA